MKLYRCYFFACLLFISPKLSAQNLTNRDLTGNWDMVAASGTSYTKYRFGENDTLVITINSPTSKKVQVMNYQLSTINRAQFIKTNASNNDTLIDKIRRISRDKIEIAVYSVKHFDKKLNTWQEIMVGDGFSLQLVRLKK